MNTLRTDSFYAERRVNGDVLIQQEGIYGQQVTVRIPMNQRNELAGLLLFDVELNEEEWTPNYNHPPYKVDYNTRPWEPE